MNSGNPNDVIMTPLERAWKAEEDQRKRDEIDMARAMALSEKKHEHTNSNAHISEKRSESTSNKYRVVPRITINPVDDHESLSLDGKGNAAIFTIKWSPDNRCIAAGHGSGRIAIHDTKTGHLHYDVMVQKSQGGSGIADPTVVSNLKFRPGNFLTQQNHYIILAAISNGQIQHWKVTSPLKDDDSVVDVAGQGCTGMHCVNAFSIGGDAKSAGLCVDYDMKGSRFAVGCKDAVVRVYDEETCSLITTLDGGEGRTYEISDVDKLLTDRGFYNMSTFQHNQIKKDSAYEVIRKDNLKMAVKIINEEQVTQVERHSNRVYSCKFASGHSSPIDHLVVSGGWDRSILVWDTRIKGPPIKSFHDAFLVGDSLDVLDSTILTGSHREANQLQVWDFRFGGAPISITPTEDNLAFAAGFSRGLTGEVTERFMCVGGVGPGPNSDLKIYDHSPHCDNALACVLPDVRGGVVALDWANVNPVDLRSASQRRNSSRGSVAGGRLVLATGDDSIRIVEVCTEKSAMYIDDEEEYLVDGEEDDDHKDLFQGSLSTSGSGMGKIIRHLALSQSQANIQLSAVPEMTSSHSEVVLPKLSPRPVSESPRGIKQSPRGTKISDEKLPQISPRGGSAALHAKLPSSRLDFNASANGEFASPSAKMHTGVDDINTSGEIDSPTARAILAAGNQIMSPDNDAVDGHINQFLDDMKNM